MKRKLLTKTSNKNNCFNNKVIKEINPVPYFKTYSHFFKTKTNNSTFLNYNINNIDKKIKKINLNHHKTKIIARKPQEKIIKKDSNKYIKDLNLIVYIQGWWKQLYNVIKIQKTIRMFLYKKYLISNINKKEIFFIKVNKLVNIIEMIFIYQKTKNFFRRLRNFVTVLKIFKKWRDKTNILFIKKILNRKKKLASYGIQILNLKKLLKRKINKNVLNIYNTEKSFYKKTIIPNSIIKINNSVDIKRKNDINNNINNIFNLKKVIKNNTSDLINNNSPVKKFHLSRSEKGYKFRNTIKVTNMRLKNNNYRILRKIPNKIKKNEMINRYDKNKIYQGTYKKILNIINIKEIFLYWNEYTNKKRILNKLINNNIIKNNITYNKINIYKNIINDTNKKRVIRRLIYSYNFHYVNDTNKINSYNRYYKLKNYFNKWQKIINTRNKIDEEIIFFKNKKNIKEINKHKKAISFSSVFLNNKEKDNHIYIKKKIISIRNNKYVDENLCDHDIGNVFITDYQTLNNVNYNISYNFNNQNNNIFQNFYCDNQNKFKNRIHKIEETEINFSRNKSNSNKKIK